MRIRLIPTLALLGALSMLGCYPSRIESIQDFDTASTLHAPDADFTGVNTYAIDDTIREIGEDEDSVNHSQDALVIANIRANLDALGWTEVDPVTTEPDIMVSVAVTTSTNTGWLVGWWDWIYGWWGWGWYYPPVYYPYSYQTGTLMVAMLDIRNPDEVNDLVPVVWVGAANGVLRSTTSTNVTVINQLIDQAFEDSPYLAGGTP